MTSATKLYQHTDQIIGPITQALSDRQGCVVLICPELAHVKQWCQRLAQYQPVVVEARRAVSVRTAFQALLQHQSTILVGTKRLALLPLTEAAVVIVIDPEDPTQQQWDQRTRYDVLTVAEQQGPVLCFSQAPLVEQVVRHQVDTSLLDDALLPEIVTLNPAALLDVIQRHDRIVLWHNRTEASLVKRLQKAFPDRPVVEVTSATKCVVPEPGSILIGTSAIFSRIPWDHVTAAVATSLDAQLAFPDYRSHEHTLQQLIQLRNRVTQLYMATYAPAHPVVQAVHQTYPAQWYSDTILERKRFHYL